jgi:hypothetical protein
MPHDQGPLSFWCIVVFITVLCSLFVRHCQPVVLVQPETAKTLKWAEGLVRFLPLLLRVDLDRMVQVVKIVSHDPIRLRSQAPSRMQLHGDADDVGVSLSPCPILSVAAFGSDQVTEQDDQMVAQTAAPRVLYATVFVRPGLGVGLLGLSHAALATLRLAPGALLMCVGSVRVRYRLADKG